MNNKALDKKLGIKHIARPKELPRLKDSLESNYNDPKYPYNSFNKKPITKIVKQKIKIISLFDIILKVFKQKLGRIK